MKSLRSKKTKVTWFVLFTLFITLYISYESIDFSDGDTILFHNGNIITMEKDHQYPEAIYIEKGIIQSIGKYDVLKNKVLPPAPHSNICLSGDKYLVITSTSSWLIHI